MDGLLHSFCLGFVLALGLKYWEEYTEDSIRKRAFVLTVVFLSFLQTVLEDYKMTGKNPWVLYPMLGLWFSVVITLGLEFQEAKVIKADHILVRYHSFRPAFLDEKVEHLFRNSLPAGALSVENWPGYFEFGRSQSNFLDAGDGISPFNFNGRCFDCSPWSPQTPSNRPVETPAQDFARESVQRTLVEQTLDNWSWDQDQSRQETAGKADAVQELTMDPVTVLRGSVGSSAPTYTSRVQSESIAAQRRAGKPIRRTIPARPLQIVLLSTNTNGGMPASASPAFIDRNCPTTKTYSRQLGIQ
ncbi:hypothetical protein B0H14DRAFT_3566295 [Mycena olivaceomarginata]|nr:hypothetical protein B0H14DRAFT_3566295 [Mycena olivaceomarginata]